MNLEAPVRLNAPPALLAWRNCRGPEDYRLLAAIGQRADLADHVEQVLTSTRSLMTWNTRSISIRATTF